MLPPCPTIQYADGKALVRSARDVTGDGGLSRSRGLSRLTVPRHLSRADGSFTLSNPPRKWGLHINKKRRLVGLSLGNASHYWPLSCLFHRKAWTMRGLGTSFLNFLRTTSPFLVFLRQSNRVCEISSFRHQRSLTLPSTFWNKAPKTTDSAKSLAYPPCPSSLDRHHAETPSSHYRQHSDNTHRK